MIEIRVQWDAARTGENALPKSHWAPRARIMREAREAGFRGWLDAGKPVVRERVLVSARICRAYRLDSLNAWGCLKPVIDGALVGRYLAPGKDHIFLPSMLPDDSDKWVKLGSVDQLIDQRYAGAEEVILFVERTE